MKLPRCENCNGPMLLSFLFDGKEFVCFHCLSAIEFFNGNDVIEMSDMVYESYKNEMRPKIDAAYAKFRPVKTDEIHCLASEGEGKREEKKG